MEQNKRHRAEKQEIPRESIHAVVTRNPGWFIGECVEIAVVSQGRTLSEVVQNLCEAIVLHLKGEDPEEFGFTDSPRLVVTYEIPNVRDAS